MSDVIKKKTIPQFMSDNIFFVIYVSDDIPQIAERKYSRKCQHLNKMWFQNYYVYASEKGY